MTGVFRYIPNNRIRWFYGFVPVLLLAAACRPPAAPPAEARSIRTFAATIERLSEPSGYFDSDNLVSNETAYLQVVPKLRALGVHGGVYLGVGPDQNFTYIAAIRPRYAFIIDIRRGNLMEHLLFKALFAMAKTRQEYLSLLFSKPLRDEAAGASHSPIEAAALPSDASIDEMIDYFDRVDGDPEAYRRNLDRILHLVSTYGLSLSAEDIEMIQQIYRAFFTRHLNLRFEYKSASRLGLSFPAYRDFLLGKDPEGRYGNFLNGEEDFRFIKAMQARDLIIPVTGDFAGEKALRGIAAYIRDRGDAVSAFYLSNVEFYLLPEGRMGAFVDNVRRLPVNKRSVLIRAFMNTPSRVHPATVGDPLMTNVLQPVRSFLRLFAEGRYRTYWDVGTADYIR